MKSRPLTSRTMPNDPAERDPIRLLLNISGAELIYETPGDAERGNPLDIISPIDCCGGTFGYLDVGDCRAKIATALASVPK